jgi:hypothetical protein
MSYATKMKKKIQEMRDMILSVTDMSDEQYQDFYFKTGCEWAESHCVANYEMLTSDSVYWGWFATEFYNLSEKWYNQMLAVDEYGISVICKNADGNYVMRDEMTFINAHYRFIMYQWLMQSSCQRAVLELSFHKKVIKRSE